MRVVTSIAAMQRQSRRWRAADLSIGFVPTMGYLHEGHLSLVKRARQSVDRNSRVVLSIYVNPTQFAPTEDLAKYPRDLDRDKRLCREAGVDVLFVPTDSEMYPVDETAKFSTFVVEETLSHPMEGVRRPTHFRGVTTVVAKLFNIVLPDVAVFGAKDFQQAAVVQRMVRDLNFPLKIVIAPTCREPDGLAMSSRNKYLSPDERAQAAALWQALQQARNRVARSKRSIEAQELRQELVHTIEQRPSARVDYIEFFDPKTLQAVNPVRAGTQMALAVFVGKTRLIDNGRLQ